MILKRIKFYQNWKKLKLQNKEDKIFYQNEYKKWIRNFNENHIIVKIVYRVIIVLMIIWYKIYWDLNKNLINFLKMKIW